MTTFVHTYSNLPSMHRVMLVSLTILTFGIAFYNPARYPALDFFYFLDIHKLSSNETTRLSSNTEYYDSLPFSNDDVESSDEPVADKSVFEHVIESGDTLGSILSQYGIEMSDVALLTKNNKSLAKMQIGQSLNWKINEDGSLQELDWAISTRETRTYIREDNIFKETKEIKQGEWSDHLIKGALTGSLSASSETLGIKKSELRALNNALGWQLNLNKLDKNDKIAAIFSRETLEGKLEQSQLVAVRIQSKNKDYYAFRAEDGKYYNKEGYAPSQGFLRTPTSKNFKVSSHFNPRRLNPVTKVIAAHNGVDYSMPVGTPVLSVGDGTVVSATRDGAAGNYITIKHNNQYTTRYMHLKSIHVKPGEKVKRGEKIGLSGNTGRSTGPHLHYEIWINGKAVNPLKANLPKTQELSGAEKKNFLKHIKPFVDQLVFE